VQAYKFVEIMVGHYYRALWILWATLQRHYIYCWAEEENSDSHGPGSTVGAFLLGRKWGLMMQQSLGPTVEDSAASITNFMRNLQASRLSSPQRLGVKEGPGAQTELGGSNR